MAKSLTRWMKRNKWQEAKWAIGLDVPKQWVKKYLYVRSIVNPLFRNFDKLRRELILMRRFD